MGTDESHTSITGLHDIETLSRLARLLLGLEQLMTKLRNFGTQLTKMVSVSKEDREEVSESAWSDATRVIFQESSARKHLLCCLVLLCPCDLILELLDLFDDTHDVN